MALGMAQRAIASGNRLFEILDREPRIESPPGAPPLPAGRGRVELRGVTLRYDGARAGADRTSTSRSRRAARSRWSGRPASGKTSLVGADRAALRPERGRGADRRRRRARGRPRPRCAARSPSSPTTASCSPPPSPRTSPTRGRTRRRRRSRRRRGGRRRTTSSAQLPDGYDTRGRRARPDALRRPAPADRDRAGAARRPADPDPRRRHLLGRRDHRGGRSRRGLREVMEGRTTFVIAHRLSTISLADEIVVLDARPDRRPRHARGAARALPAATRRSPSTGSRTRSSCSATSRSARSWREL